MAVVADCLNPKLGIVERVTLGRNRDGNYVFLRRDLPARERRKRINQIYEPSSAHAEARARSGLYNGRCVRPSSTIANEFTNLKVV